MKILAMVIVNNELPQIVKVELRQSLVKELDLYYSRYFKYDSFEEFLQRRILVIRLGNPFDEVGELVDLNDTRNIATFMINDIPFYTDRYGIGIYKRLDIDDCMRFISSLESSCLLHPDRD